MKNSIPVERAKKRMTQGDLADATGTSRQTIHQIESGKSEPKVSLAIRIARFFGIAVEDVFEYEEA